MKGSNDTIEEGHHIASSSAITQAAPLQSKLSFAGTVPNKTQDIGLSKRRVHPSENQENAVQANKAQKVNESFRLSSSAETISEGDERLSQLLAQPLEQEEGVATSLTQYTGGKALEETLNLPSNPEVDINAYAVTVCNILSIDTMEAIKLLINPSIDINTRTFIAVNILSRDILATYHERAAAEAIQLLWKDKSRLK